MIENNTSSALYLSWRSAWRMRCCPPDKLLYGQGTKELSEHLQVCPWCREERAAAVGEPDFPVVQGAGAEKKKPSVEPGQLWSLREDLGGWGPKNRYYSPPLVVIAEVGPGSVAVLQAYGDMDLAGIDDLPLQNGLVGFCQPWNRYTLRIDDLESCYGAAFDEPDKELASSATIQEQVAAPGSLLWFFRQMEVETGYFFAARALPQLLAEHEANRGGSGNALKPFESDLKNMGKQLEALGLIVPQPPSAEDSPVDMLFSVQAPEDLLPLAAADRGGASAYALRFTLNNGQIDRAEATGLHITAWQREGALLHINGHLAAPVSDSPEIFFRLQAENQFIDPIPGEYGIENDFFWVLFQVEERKIVNGELVVRIITEQS